MSSKEPPRALISYAHGGHARDRRVRELANRLRKDGVECDLDQYHESPEPGWPTWMGAEIGDAKRTILVISSAAYLRRWALAEEAGVGLGAKYEGKLIRQRMYEEEGLNGTVVPVVLEPADSQFIPFELRDVTRYDASNADGYDKLLRRLTGQSHANAPMVGPGFMLLGEQDPRIAAAFFLLRNAPAPLPLDVLGGTVALDKDELTSQFSRPPLAAHTTISDGLLSTTYYRPVAPRPEDPSALFSTALRELLRHCRERGSESGPFVGRSFGTRCILPNNPGCPRKSSHSSSKPCNRR